MTKDPILGLRNPLREFVMQMEYKLREHDAEKGEVGWCGDSPTFLLKRVREELQEAEIVASEVNLDRLEQEVVDVANMCMMVWDVLNERKKHATST